MDPVAGLKSDIKELKDALLDADVLDLMPPEDLTRRQQLLITSFVILSHAHIEEFIEQLFLAYVEERGKEITESLTPHCFVRLSLHFSGDLVGQGASKKFSNTQVCQTAANLYRSKVVKINNGLKEANISAMAKPLGLLGETLSDSCDNLFAAVNTLGGKRGKMAHTSSSQSASETIYANQALTWVNDVVNNIPELIGFLKNPSPSLVPS